MERLGGVALKPGRELTWFIIRFFRSLFLMLPHGVSLRMGAFMGKLLWALSKKRVDKAEIRAVQALGTGVTNARRIVRGSYINLGRSIAEIFRMPKINRLDDLISFHGEDNLEKAINRGKGVIFLTSHFGNWELLAAYVASKGYPMNAIGAQQRDPRITDLIIETREKLGVHTISKGFNLKSAIQCLKRGEILGVLIDQDVRDKGVIVPFMGLPASTPYGPVKIAHKLGSPVLPVFIVRKDDHIHHDIYILPPLEDPEGNPFGEDVEGSTRICNDVLSEWITSHPDHWLWLYPRWASTLGK